MQFRTICKWKIDLLRQLNGGSEESGTKIFKLNENKDEITECRH